jgi:hypothetical protein
MTKFQARAQRILASRVFAKKFRPYKSNGEERDTKELLSQIADFETELLVRLAREQLAGGEKYSFRELVKLAARLLDERNFERFVLKIGKGGGKPIFDRINRAILAFWDGFDTEQIAQDPKLRALRTWPPLSRWRAQAACDLVNWSLPKDLHVTYLTYLRRVERLRLESEKPILVTRVEDDDARKQLRIVLSPAGEEWIATQTDKKMSQYKITRALFNTASEKGKNGLKQSSRKKRCINRRAAV